MTDRENIPEPTAGDGNRVAYSGEWIDAPILLVSDRAWGQELLFLDIPAPATISLSHYDNGKSVIRSNDDSFTFDTTEIASIEEQSDSEFRKVQSDPKGFNYPIRKNTGGKLFAQRLGIDYHELKKPHAAIKIICVIFGIIIAASLVATVVYLSIVSIMESIFPVTDSYAASRSKTALSRLWWEGRGFAYDEWANPLDSTVLILGFGSLAIAGIAALVSAILLGKIYMANRSEDTATMMFFASARRVVVMYMTDGRAVTLATSYRNPDLTRKAHAAHLNAWATAKLAVKNRRGDDLNDYV